jgi:hypothetical protein
MNAVSTPAFDMPIDPADPPDPSTATIPPTRPDPGTRDGGGALKLRDTEPVTIVSSVINGFKTLVLAVLALALAFGWVDWTNDQNAAVLGVVAAAFVIISSIATAFLRQKVTPLAQPRDEDGSALEAIK